MSKRATKSRTAELTGVPDMEFTVWDDDAFIAAVGKPGKAMKKKKVQSINDTGIEPVEFRCVVRLDPVEEKTIGGIIIPDERRDRNQMSATRATLLACGGNAFSDWKGLIPVPGDRIEVSKYAGITREADPTDLVRLIQDKEILGVLA